MTMRTALLLAAVALSPLVEATVHREVVPSGLGLFRAQPLERNFTEEILKIRRGPTLEELNEERMARKQRAKERSERAREMLQSHQPDPSDMKRMTKEQINRMEEEHPWMRRAAWGSSSGGEWADFLEDPSQEYDKWAQAYRFLGGYIDCDNDKSQGSGDRDRNDGNDNGITACSRWMIWAAVRKKYAVENEIVFV